MLRITVSEKELKFEHSLVSLREWEAEFERPFFAVSDTDTKTEEEMFRYFEMMYVGKSKHEHLIRLIDEDQALQLVNYINAKRTATVVNSVQKKSGPKENVTAELIYYWLIAFKIPFKPVDEWHLNQALKLVEVASVKSQPPKKMTRAERAAQVEKMRQLNAQRRAAAGSKG